MFAGVSAVPHFALVQFVHWTVAFAKCSALPWPHRIISGQSAGQGGVTVQESSLPRSECLAPCRRRPTAADGRWIALGNLDFDGLGFGLLIFGQMHSQDAVLEVSRDLGGVRVIRYGEGSDERTAGPLHPMILL